MSCLAFDPLTDPVTARITAADLPPEGPVFVLCLTTRLGRTHRSS